MIWYGATTNWIVLVTDAAGVESSEKMSRQILVELAGSRALFVTETVVVSPETVSVGVTNCPFSVSRTEFVFTLVKAFSMIAEKFCSGDAPGPVAGRKLRANGVTCTSVGMPAAVGDPIEAT